MVRATGLLLQQPAQHDPGRRAAAPIFWTLGAQQVGKAAIAAWRELLQAQHHDNHECEALCGSIGKHSMDRAAGLATETVNHYGDNGLPEEAAAVLEVLAGLRTPAQAAQALGLSVNYYYVLERKALAALVAVMIMVSVGTMDWHSVHPTTLRRMPPRPTSRVSIWVSEMR